MMIVKQVYLDHLNRPVGSFEALKSGLINKSQTTHDRLEKIWKKNGENVEQKWRKCGAKMELIRKESGENPEKTKRDVGRTVFSCYCLFVGFPQIPATSGRQVVSVSSIAEQRARHVGLSRFEEMMKPSYREGRGM